MMRVLLLNPPGKETYLRDQYCGVVGRANYYWHPLDLLLLSGTLSKEHDVRVLDAVVARLSVETALNKIAEFQPEIIVSLSSILSLQEDLDFFEQCKKRFNCRIVVSGDAYYFEPERMIRYPMIDAILLNYTSTGILQYLRGDKAVTEVTYKDKGGAVYGKAKDDRTFSYPPPRYDLFPLDSYTMPFIKHAPFVSIVTNLGCPFSCKFCPMKMVRYRERDLDNLFSELDALHSLGIRELMFRDPTFGANIARAKEICREMIRRRYNFSWSCDNRIDCTDDELLSLMRDSGCHTIMFGVESGNNDILKIERKNITVAEIRARFHKCRQLGIQTLAHILIGFQEDTEESIMQTMRLVLDLECDYLAVNIYVPRYGSQLRENMLAGGEHPDGQSERARACILPRTRLEHLQKMFLLRFYANPPRIIRFLSSIRTVTQARMMFRNVIGAASSIMFHWSKESHFAE